MRISRRASFLASASIIVLFFGIGAILLSLRSTHLPLLSTNSTQSSDPSGNTNVPRDIVIPNQSEGLFSINNFHRSESKDGKTKWEITGDSASLHPDKDGILVINPDLTLYGDDGKSSKLTTKQAFVVIDGTTLKMAKLSGEVKATYTEGTTAKTEEAIYDRTNETLHTLKPVQVDSSQFKISSERFAGDLKGQVFKFEGNVKTEIQARKKTAKELKQVKK